MNEEFMKLMNIKCRYFIQNFNFYIVLTMLLKELSI